ncbi:MAG: 3,4-dihydroxy-2-butanone-4-phosphate synthase [Candidatus Eutrophobiaceae bacterium]
MKLNSTKELISELSAGRMIVLMDDEDRENEGDLIIPAQNISAEQINFMARYGRGLICLTLTKQHCKRLNLQLVPQSYSVESQRTTNFTVSIEAASGVTTGISAADRAHTIRTATATDSQPADLVQPGHIFPLMAQSGGVLARAGHTEAGCDLCRLAGLTPAAVIVEILNEDGSMARRPDLEVFAAHHGLKIGTIADLIRYRIRNEKTIQREAERTLNSAHGEFKLVIYKDLIGGHLHYALVKGKIDPASPIWVRVQLQNPLVDLSGIDGQGSVWTIDNVRKRLQSQECGIIVYLCGQFKEDQLIAQLQDIDRLKAKKVEKQRAENSAELRTIGLGAQILADLGVRRMRVLSAPKRIHALSGFNLEVVEYLE